MTDPAAGPSKRDDPQAEHARQRRRARVFGDVLPDSTSDERGPGVPDEGATEDWLRREVPPHHG